MFWINFLHIYQPVNTDAYNIKEATEKSYKRIVKALEDNPGLKMTININGCLFYRWEELGYRGLIERFARLVREKRLEITGNAAYHPLLPLIAPKEAKRQIKETESVLKKYFGKDFKPEGFFFSEMAYSREAAILVKHLGYEWTVLDEIAYRGKLGAPGLNRVFEDAASGLKVVFRSRKPSHSFVPDVLDEYASDRGALITATDGELYGLRHLDPTGKFEKTVKRKDIDTGLVGDFIRKAGNPEKTDITASSWESSEEEIKTNRPYALWADKNNDIQNALWQLASLAYDAVEDSLADENYLWARWHLKRGLASCTFWWASGKDFSQIFGPLAWSPDEIERGCNELIRSIRALDNVETREIKMKAEKMYIELKRKIWEQHWTYYWKKNIDKSV